MMSPMKTSMDSESAGCPCCCHRVLSRFQCFKLSAHSERFNAIRGRARPTHPRRPSRRPTHRVCVGGGGRGGAARSAAYQTGTASHAGQSSQAARPVRSVHRTRAEPRTERTGCLFRTRYNRIRLRRVSARCIRVVESAGLLQSPANDSSILGSPPCGGLLVASCLAPASNPSANMAAASSSRRARLSEEGHADLRVPGPYQRRGARLRRSHAENRLRRHNADAQRLHLRIPYALAVEGLRAHTPLPARGLRPDASAGRARRTRRTRPPDRPE